MKFLIILTISLALNTVYSYVQIPITKKTQNPTAKEIIASAKARLHRFSRENGPSFNEPLINGNEMLYYGSVSVGTPPQQFIVDFDTGITYFWIPTKNCSSCGDHKKYDHSKSSTYKANGTKVFVPNVLGFASGFISDDNVCIGKACVKQQQFLEVDNEMNIQKYAFDGMMGMAFGALSSVIGIPNVNTVFKNMIEQNVVDEPVFSFFLNQNVKGELGGELTLGGVNKSHYQGELKTIPLSRATYWEININGIGLEGGASPSTSYRTIVDTGTSLLLGPIKIIHYIIKKLGATPKTRGLSEVPCAKVPSLPDVNIYIGNDIFPLKSKDYILKTDGKCLIAFFGVMEKSNSKKVEFILGDVFLRAYYSVYNLNEEHISFARSSYN